MVFSNHEVTPDPVPANGIATLKMVVENNGPDTANGVTLTDILPSGATFLSMSASQGVCSTSAPYSCTIGDLAKSANATVTLQVRMPTAGVYDNSASISSTSTDLNTANNQSLRKITVSQAANLGITATSAARDDTYAGDAMDYELVVNNSGPDPLPTGESVSVSFNVPAGATLTAVPNGDGWTCTPATGYPLTNPPNAGGQIQCTRSDGLQVGTSYPGITVPATGNVSGTISANFGVSSSFPDSDTGNNNAQVDVVLVPGADMSIDKTVSPNYSVAVGTTMAFTLKAGQQGGMPPSGVTVTDTLPAGLSYVSHSAPAPWDCSFEDGTLSCTYPGTWDGGAYSTLPAITLKATTTQAGSIANEAGVTADQPDPDDSNNSSIAKVSSNSNADHQITKTPNITPVAVGQDYSYAIVARNLGPASVPRGQAIYVTDNVPAGMSLRARPTGPGWACTSDQGTAYPQPGPLTVVCTRTDGIGTPANWPTITVPVRNTVEGSLANNACVSLQDDPAYPTDDNDKNNCVNSSNSATNQRADLSITKTAPATAAVGDTVTYVLTTSNAGPDVATNVIVRDVINNLLSPLGLVSITTNKAGATCTPAAPSTYTNTIAECKMGSLAVGESAVVTIVVKPNNTTGAVLTRNNTATVKSQDIVDPNDANNSATATTQIAPRADVTVSKTVSPDIVSAGQPLSYVVTARNNGPSAAVNVVVRDVLPANTSFITLGVVSNGGTCTTPAANATSGEVVCTWAAIPAKTQYTASFELRAANAAAGGTITNQAVVTTDTPESDTTNNQASVSADVTVAMLDILVHKTINVDPVPLGDEVVFTVTTTNVGPSTGTHLVVTDTFPHGTPTARFSYQGGLLLSDPSGSCTEPPIGAIEGVLVCQFPAIYVAADNAITMTYKMKAESITAEGAYSGTQINHVAVKVDETETTMANNETDETATTRRSAVDTDLALVKAVDKAKAKAGDELVYTLTVTNNGPMPSTGAQIIDPLPVGISFVSSADGCVTDGSTVTCSVGRLAIGDSKVFHLRVQVAKPYSATGTVVNTAKLDAPGDTKPDNNTGTTTTEIQPEPDLALLKNVDKTTTKAGDPLVYTLVVTNHGPGASAPATVTDTLPAGLNFVQASDGCANNAGTITCAVGVLAEGAAQTLQITTQVAKPFTGSSPLSNTAKVDAPGDPKPDNNSSTVTTEVTTDVVVVPPSGPQPIPTLDRLALLLLGLCMAGFAALRLRTRPV